MGTTIGFLEKKSEFYKSGRSKLDGGQYNVAHYTIFQVSSIRISREWRKIWQKRSLHYDLQMLYVILTAISQTIT